MRSGMLTNTFKILLYSLVFLGVFSCEEDMPVIVEETCEDTVTDIDGNTYPVVRIGSQCWMAENLRTTRYSNGTDIPFGEDGTPMVITDSTRYYFNYPDDPSYFEIWGDLFELLHAKSQLYTWAAATNLQSDGSEDATVQGVCPQGWHLPNKLEWDELINFVGVDSAGIKLKSAVPMYWNNDFPEAAGNDEFGFNSIASGGRDSAGGYYIFDIYAFYWSASTQEGEDWRVLTPHLVHYSEQVQWLGYSKTNSFCVRCIKDL